MAAVFTILGLLSGCAGDSDSDSQIRIEPRVLSAVTPSPGSDSYYDRLWLIRKLDHWRIPQVKQCLEQHGRKDLWPRAEEALIRGEQGVDPRLPSKKLLEEVGLDWRRGPDAHAEIDDKDIVLWDCAEGEDDDPSAGARDSKLFRDLETIWDDQLNKVLQDPKYDSKKREVDSCLMNGGAQLNPHDDGSVGNGWEGDFVLGASSIDSMTAEQSRAAGKLMVKCNQRLWNEWEAALTPHREAFVDQHERDLARLTEVIDNVR